MSLTAWLNVPSDRLVRRPLCMESTANGSQLSQRLSAHMRDMSQLSHSSNRINHSPLDLLDLHETEADEAEPIPRLSARMTAMTCSSLTRQASLFAPKPRRGGASRRSGIMNLRGFRYLARGREQGVEMHNCCFIEDHAHALPTLCGRLRAGCLVSPTLSWVFELFEKQVRMRARMEAEWDVLRRLWRSPVSSRGAWLSFVCCFMSIGDVHPLFLFRGCAIR